MRSLHTTAAALGLVAVAGSIAHAEELLPVTAVTETDEAIYFEPADPALDDIVFFFPKFEVTFGLYSPGVSSAYAATLVMKDVTPLEPGELRPEWETKVFQPYILRPTTECELDRVPEMRFVNQLIRVSGRDVSYPQGGTPVCQFTFRLPATPSDELLDALQERASAGTLIGRDIELAFDRRLELPWYAVHDVLAADPALTGDEVISHDEAVFLIVVAVMVQELVPVDLLALPPEQRQAMVDAGLAELFDAVPGGLALRSESPTTGFTLDTVVERHAL